MASEGPRKTYNDYTVGWVSAREDEWTAATAMFDEEHPALARKPGDDHLYAFGRIGPHNVVMACLPSKGNISAAGVAQGVKTTFTKMKIGLMVGIGGGVPSKRHDIRLGDIAVSAPTDASGGVVEWDRGKAEEGGAFVRTGHLNEPPHVLQGAVTRVSTTQSKHDDYRWMRHISTAFEKYPALQRKYSRPDSADRLFKSAYPHEGGKGNCDGCSRASEILDREPRDVDKPHVHPGLIGTGSKTMKDGKLRDALAEPQDIICFEMEASGLMNSFPSLVIRGISSYSDSHKNDAWHRYAAMVAAAYAKEILLVTPPEEAQQMQTIHVQAVQTVFHIHNSPSTSSATASPPPAAAIAPAHTSPGAGEVTAASSSPSRSPAARQSSSPA